MQLIQLSTCLTAFTSFAIFPVFQFVRKYLTLFCQYKYISQARLYINCQCVQKAKVLENYCDDLQLIGVHVSFLGHMCKSELCKFEFV